MSLHSYCISKRPENRHRTCIEACNLTVFRADDALTGGNGWNRRCPLAASWGSKSGWQFNAFQEIMPQMQPPSCQLERQHKYISFWYRKFLVLKPFSCLVFRPKVSQKWVVLHPWPIIQTWPLEHCPTFKLKFSTSFKCNTTLLFFLLCIAENICPPQQSSTHKFFSSSLLAGPEWNGYQMWLRSIPIAMATQKLE